MGKILVSKEIKERIITLQLTGNSTRKVQLTLKNISQSCVTKTIAKWKKTGSTLDKIRSGRPRKTTTTVDNSIYKIARKNPKYSAKQIAHEINLALKNDISRQAVNRRLIDRKLCSYTAARKPMLKRSDRLKRFESIKKRCFNKRDKMIKPGAGSTYLKATIKNSNISTKSNFELEETITENEDQIATPIAVEAKKKRKIINEADRRIMQKTFKL
ncbi:uncharacterized protein LOC124815989 [Hydra vulgaris]|uniref:uncharacterized protein LOC124815989 n=1 Tax=Hydra vulgaris TaxID=6087 RepID=UPI001F5F9470|nr:uncharacterized protein LOC124815989 [Hydra vulgaris]